MVIENVVWDYTAQSEYYKASQFIRSHVERVSYTDQVQVEALFQSLARRLKIKTTENNDKEHPVVESGQITDFETPSTVVSGTQLGHPGSYSFIKENREHDVKNYLQRPVFLASSTWTTIQTPNTVLISVDMPDLANESPMVRGKLDGFRYFRATMKFRIIVNSSPFSLGRLIAWWSPLDAIRGDYGPQPYLQITTGYPHVEIDAGTGNSGILTVPFYYPAPMYDILTPVPEWGVLNVSVMNTLNVPTGPANAEISIYKWYEDIILSAPAPNALAQSEGQKAAESGMISAPAKKIGSIASLIGEFPLGPVSEIANAVAWTSNIVGGVAEAFGYSKPTTEESNRRMTPMQGSGLTNFNGTDNSVVLGYDTHNSLSINTKTFSDDRDEMDISYIVSRPCYLKTFTWTDTQVAGEILTQWNVDPGICGVAGSSLAPTLQAYIASLFLYWRGELAYRISFIKNNFYSGRIALAFISGSYLETSPVDVERLEAAPKIICDIRDNGECEISVPYISKYAFLRTRVRSSGVGNNQNCLGSIVAYVVNPLRHNDQVSGTVEANIYIRMGPDAEFAVPDNLDFTPNFGVATPMPLAEAQMYKTQPLIGLGDAEAPSGKDMFEKRGLAALEGGLLVTGEKITNLRNLTRMFNQITVAGSQGPFTAVSFDPAFMGGSGVLSPGVYTRLFHVGGCFVSFRGGMRYKVVPFGFDTGTSTYVMTGVTRFSQGIPIAPGTTPATGTDVGFEQPVNLNNTPMLEFQVPYYRIWTSVPRSTLQWSTDPRLVVNVQSIDQTNPVFNCAVYQAAADDFSFGYLVGAPLLEPK